MTSVWLFDKEIQSHFVTYQHSRLTNNAIWMPAFNLYLTIASPKGTASFIRCGQPQPCNLITEIATRGPFLESPDNFSGPESCFMNARFSSKIAIFVGFKSCWFVG